MEMEVRRKLEEEEQRKKDEEERIKREKEEADRQLQVNKILHDPTQLSLSRFFTPPLLSRFALITERLEEAKRHSVTVSRSAVNMLS